MKRIYISALLAGLFLCSKAQVSTQNYVRTRTITNESGSTYLDKIQYHDGLGRPFMWVEKGNGGNQTNLISLQEYDVCGREAKSWLPVTSASEYVEPSTLKNLATGTAMYNDSRPYNQPLYEASPLNRVLQQYGSGAAWSSKPIATDYATNTASGDLQCTLYQINENGTLATGSYTPSELYVTKITDEDGHVAYTFTDKQGRTVLARQMKGAEKHDTYFVYDAFGNLRIVLPPLYQENANLDLYAYQYKYDSRKRCIEKKLPGCRPVYYRYDQADNLIFSQDGIQRTKGEWTFSLYDKLHRITLQGTCNNSNTATVSNVVVRCTFSASGGGIGNTGYTSVFALVAPTIHQANYYDNYQFVQLPAFANKGQFHNGSTTAVATGFPTGSLTTMFSSNESICSATYYDIKGRPTQLISNNHLGGFEVVNTAYTFTGKPSTVQHVHSAYGKATQTEVTTYLYDHAERISKVTHKLNNNAAVTVTENSYDQFGRLLTRKHGTNATSYSYNIRNWLTGLAHPLFTQNLYYNTGNGAPAYNGNISSMTWKAGTEAELRGYKFSYDGLNRLTTANYGEGSGINTNPGRFSESVSAYDKQGNIKSLQRYGKTGAATYGMIDNLTFAHNGNQLKYVNDAASIPAVSGAFNFVDGSKSTGNEYAYDANGNLTQDLNKNIAGIQYNSLNLPQTLQFAKGNATSYLYGADGVKKRVSHQTGSETIATDYCSNVIYENGNLSKILITDGYITMSGSTPAYHYYLKDYQGNNRVVMSPSNATEQVNHYYPFGGLFTEGIDTSGQPYKYNGKELDRKNGLDWYDYQARMMDPNLGFMPTIDPLCEKFYSISPYAYCANNPVRYVDPDGKEWRPTYDTDHEEKTKPTGYEWVEKFEAYNEDGTAKKGIYVQAIFFSDNGNFDASSKKNMGSSTATVYLADGTMQTFDANTYPSGDKYATVPEGMYHATVGKHKGSYPALRMSDTDGSGRIELGVPNPAHPERTYAEGINIHKPGGGNLTGTDRKGRAISAGCLLVDINNWNTFINLFDNDSQRENTISVTVSRSLTIPVNANRLPAFNFILNGTRASFFNRKFK